MTALIPPRDGIDIGDYSLRDFAAKWLMQQCDLAQTDVYRAANATVRAARDDRRRIVFMGDSITEFWDGLAGFESAATRVLNRGIRGQNSSQMLLRFQDDAISLRPALIVLLCGSNDLRSYVGEAASVGEGALERIHRNVTSMVDIASSRGVKMLLSSLPPVDPRHPVHRDPQWIQRINAALAALASARSLEFVDYHGALVDGQGCLPGEYSEDGVHPNAPGYARMREALAAALSRMGFSS